MSPFRCSSIAHQYICNTLLSFSLPLIIKDSNIIYNGNVFSLIGILSRMSCTYCKLWLSCSPHLLEVTLKNQYLDVVLSRSYFLLVLVLNPFERFIVLFGRGSDLVVLSTLREQSAGTRLTRFNTFFIKINLSLSLSIVTHSPHKPDDDLFEFVVEQHGFVYCPIP